MTELAWNGNGPRIAVFGFDITEASQIRRIRSLIEAGCDVISFAQRREEIGDDRSPEWPHVDLGRVGHHGYARRAGMIGKGIATAARYWRVIADADLIIGRNIDLALIALGARRAASIRARRRPAPFVYEVLDIHSLFTRNDKVAQIMKTAEKRVLASSDALVISSPAFNSEYFGPVQGWNGKTILIENKLYLGNAPKLRERRPKARPAPGPVLRLGLVGSIRCAPSLKILSDAAERLGDQVEIRLHGNVHRHAVPDFDAILQAHANITYLGPYAYPEGLLECYEDCDLVWAQDLWQRGTNSDWLLPNRIYEASWAGCPQIAVAGTQTGRRVEDDGLGFVIAEPTGEALCDLLQDLAPQDIKQVSDALLSRNAADFVQSPADLAELVSIARKGDDR